MDVPDTPTIGTATDGGNVDASVTFTAATTGGTPASYTVTSTPGSITGTGSSSPITVSGLTAGTAYTFKVKAANAAGTFGPESSASNSVTPAFPVVGAYDSLASVTLASAASSISFTGIPTGYKHLQVRLSTRNVANTGGDLVQMRMNGDAGANYANHYLYGSGASTAVSGFPGTGSTYSWIGYNVADANYPTNTFSAIIVDILDYASNNKNKVVRSLSGADGNGLGWVALLSSLWLNTATVTSLTIYPYNLGSNNFATYTTAALYGVK
jgi:hypothetical protein